MADRGLKITLWGIEVFLAVAEERSISAAARRLGASPSAVSQQLTNLETALDAELTNRRARPITLTQAGAAFLRHAQTIVSEAVLARSQLARLDMSNLTRLRLGMIEDFDSTVTPTLLADMSGVLREARFELETGPSHRLLDRLDTRALDMIVAADTGETEDWMEVHPLMHDPFLAVVPRGSDVAPDALPDLPLIAYTQRHAMGRILANHLARQNLSLSRRFELDSYRAILALVAGGAGWTILSTLGVLHAGRFADDIDVIPLPGAPLSRTISLYARREGVPEMAQDIAQRLRVLIETAVVAPSRAAHPWLGDRLAVLK